MTYEADDEEADKIYEFVDKNMDARRRARGVWNGQSPFLVYMNVLMPLSLSVIREAREATELSKFVQNAPRSSSSLRT